MTASTATSGVWQITSIDGWFTDSSDGISGAITGPVPCALPGPPPFNSPGVQAPWSSFDNLFYPNSDAPIVCSGYPVPGGAVDTYGVLFNVAGGYTAELWSDGNFGGGPIYNAADANASGFLDYPNPALGTGVTVGFTFNAVPEPSSFAGLGLGALGLLVFKRRKR